MSTLDSSTLTERTIRLPDGRALGYAEFGDPKGQPVFHFHGWPSSRREAQLFHEPAARAGIRLIGVDRPGIGLSDFQPGRRILDWPDDVVALADALEIESFAVQGLSGGGPYAAACAYKIPDRLTACGIVAGLGPLALGTEGLAASARAFFFVAGRLPWLLRPLLWLMMGRFAQDQRKVQELVPKLAQKSAEQDRDALLDPDLKKLLAAGLMGAFRQGTRGPAQEYELYARPWGFELEEVSFDKVHLWHGERDANVPVSMGRAVAERIPNCQAILYPDEAHLTLVLNHSEQIITALVS